MKARMSQMRVSKNGPSFDEAAATSIKAPKPLEDCHTRFEHGQKVIYRDEEWEVCWDGGYVGLDGRHWVKIRKGDWAFHVHCSDLKRG
jgi:hypothetical protein